MSVKDWIARMRGGLREVTQSMRTGLARLSKAALHRIARGWNYLGTKTIRVWLWTFAAIAAYVIFSFYVYSALLSADTRIDDLSFWDTKPEDARNLILVIGGWLGVLAAIVGFVLAGFRTSTQMQMTQTAIDGQVTERFTRAVEQLGHKERAVRLGAIYALERIARDSPRDRDTIVETLAAYIRELAPWPPRHKDGRPFDDSDLEGEQQAIENNPMLLRPPVDISAATIVICRLLPDRDAMRPKTDLRYADLRGLDAPNINLSEMRLDHSNLRRADLSHAKLNSARMAGTILEEADLRFDANLRGANLNFANLSRANMTWANLSHANLFMADMSGANLGEANLSGAHLGETNLSGAHMRDTDLSEADLVRVKNLTQKQINSIRYHRNNPPRNLPAGLTLPEPYDG